MLSLNPLKFITRALNLDGESFKYNWVAAGVAVAGMLSANSAAKKQRQAAADDRASQERMAEASLAEQKRQYDIGQENLAPYREAGTQALEQYQGMLGEYTPTELPQFQGEYQDPGAFQGVTNIQEDPSYQFRLNQGLQALDRMASRGGERYSGKRGIALQDYGQRAASQEYGAAYSRSLSRYGLDVQRADAAYGREMGRYGLDYQRARDADRGKLGQLSMYANLAGSGQQAAGASSTLGANYASQVSNINTNLASGLSGTYQRSGAAQAAGIMGQYNAAASGLMAYNYNQGRQQPNYNTNYNPKYGAGSQGTGWDNSQYNGWGAGEDVGYGEDGGDLGW